MKTQNAQRLLRWLLGWFSLAVTPVSAVYASSITVSGTISGNTAWSTDTVRVSGDLTVANGSILTIEPGVHVIFEGHYLLTVNGVLKAMGSPADSIVFTVADTTGFGSYTPDAGGWGGIRFIAAVPGQIQEIQYARFQFIRSIHGLVIGTDGGQAMPISIQNCSFSYNRCINLVYVAHPQVHLSHVLIHHHQALYPGPPNPNTRLFYFNDDSQGMPGTILLDHMTMVYNSASPFEFNIIQRTQQVVLHNSIVWGNTGNIQFTPWNTLAPSAFQAQYSIVEFALPTDAWLQPTCIQAVPAFVNTAGGDFRLDGTIPSRGIDEGDIRSAPDPDQTLPDLGALYYDQGPGTRSPSAWFEADTTEGYRSELTVQFQDYSFPGSEGIETWYWDFGDGGASGEKSPVHTYMAPNTYTVTLIVRDSSGVSDTLIRPNLIRVRRGTWIGGGVVSGDWVSAFQPYYVYGSVEVLDTLRIHAGVRVEFQEPGLEMVVRGSLFAEGYSTPYEYRIVFDVADTSIYEQDGILYRKGWGGIRFMGGDSSVLMNCDFLHGQDGRLNTSGAYDPPSGVILAEYTPRLRIENCIFRNNVLPPPNYTATDTLLGEQYIHAGAVTGYESHIEISGSVFSGQYGNVANSRTNLIAIYRGSLIFNNNRVEHCNASTSIYALFAGLDISHSYFMGNSAGIYSFLPTTDTISRQYLKNNIFEYNEDPVLKILGDNTRLENNIFRENAGMVDLDGNNTLATGNLFYHNIANEDSCGVLTVRNGISRVINNTFVENTHTQPAFGGGALSGRFSSVTSINNLFADNDPYDWSLMAGWVESCRYTTKLHRPSLIPVASNSYAPFFREYGWDFRLLPNSRLINLGKSDTTGLALPASDLNGNPRIGGGRIDIGAFEYASSDAVTTEIPGLLVYLAPASRKLVIESDQGRLPDTYRLIDLQGRLLRSGVIPQGTRFDIDTHDLLPGICILSLSSPQGHYSQTFILR